MSFKTKVFLPKYKTDTPSKTDKVKKKKELPVDTEKKDNKVRLQKVLARAGIASRRNAEELILEGAVTVNNKLVTELGTKVDPLHDKIRVSGNMISLDIDMLYIAFYKPVGVISALSDPEDRPCLASLIKTIGSRVIPIGRLDFNSEGLILLTNDGDLANKILKKRDLKKTYLVKIKGHPEPKDLEFMKKGIFTKEGVLRIADFGVEKKLYAKSWLRLEVTEGSKLDIREILNHRGLNVDKIIRTEIGSIDGSDLAPGEFKFMHKKDFAKLVSS